MPTLHRKPCTDARCAARYLLRNDLTALYGHLAHSCCAMI
jgi:hypothetical protein